MTLLENATGIIKKVFLGKIDPYGFFQILTPLEMRGKETTFFVEDVKLASEDQALLHPGLIMQFDVIEKPEDRMKNPIKYKAVNIRPREDAEYSATVVKSPNREGKNFLVALDWTMGRAIIEPSSYKALGLKKAPSPGDECSVRIHWKEYLRSNERQRLTVAQIVSVKTKQSHLSATQTEELQDIPTTSTEGSNESVSPNDRSLEFSCSHNHSHGRNVDNVDDIARHFKEKLRVKFDDESLTPIEYSVESSLSCDQSFDRDFCEDVPCQGCHSNADQTLINTMCSLNYGRCGAPSVPIQFLPTHHTMNAFGALPMGPQQISDFYHSGFCHYSDGNVLNSFPNTPLPQMSSGIRICPFACFQGHFNEAHQF